MQAIAKTRAITVEQSHGADGHAEQSEARNETLQPRLKASVLEVLMRMWNQSVAVLFQVRSDRSG